MKLLKKVLIGIIAGIISGLFSSGGGLILVPAFIYLLGLDERVARGTTIVCILPMVITSSILYSISNFVEWKIGLMCVLGGIIGGIIGAKLLKKLPIAYIRIVFIVFLLYMSIKLLIQ